MPFKLIEIIAGRGHVDTIEAIAQRFKALTFWKENSSSDDSAACRIVARPEQQQKLIDELQGALGHERPWRITIMPVDATIPEVQPAEPAARGAEQAPREALYGAIDRGARIDVTFLILVVLSTVVATIGLRQDSQTIVIAAMLIAPLLGPNVAMAFGSTLGDRELLGRAAVANATGLSLSIVCAGLAGVVLPVAAPTAQLLSRTQLGYDSLLLALAAGGAGALSLTTDLPSALVGVMVAVALLPPAATAGYMLGIGRFALAADAAALLAANVVCVNLSAQVVFLAKGIKPRTWIQRRAAQESIMISLAISGGLLVVLIALVYWLHR